MDWVRENLSQLTDNNFVIALVILVVGWFVAKVVAALVVRALRFTSFSKVISDKLDLGTGKKGSFESGVGSITFWVLMLIVLITVLDVLQLKSVISPLNNLLDKIWIK